MKEDSVGPARERLAAEHIRLLEVADLEAQAALDLTQASHGVAEVADRARKLQRLVGDALAATDSLSAYDWEDIHREIGKLVAQIREGRDLGRRTGISSYLERRISTAVLRVEEDAERCVDSVWYLRSVARLTEDAEHIFQSRAERPIALRLRWCACARSIKLVVRFGRASSP